MLSRVRSGPGTGWDGSELKWWPVIIVEGLNGRFWRFIERGVDPVGESIYLLGVDFIEGISELVEKRE